MGFGHFLKKFFTMYYFKYRVLTTYHNARDELKQNILPHIEVKTEKTPSITFAILGMSSVSMVSVVRW